MKKLIAIFFLVGLGKLNAQDVFQKHLFSADLILKHKTEIGLSSDIEGQIKNLYNEHIVDFNSLRWDLDEQMAKMGTLLSFDKVDIAAANSQIKVILQTEEKLKKMKFEMMVTLKNLLNAEQQSQLMALKNEGHDNPLDFTTSLNENPRVSVKVKGKIDSSELLFVIKDAKGKTTQFKSKSDSKAIKDIDPNKIESISVLKGESAMEAYGKEGENGVVIIVLKK
ncbi:MAG: hypothetical protein RLO12_10350 [Fulvivirga sp.]